MGVAAIKLELGKGVCGTASAAGVIAIAFCIDGAGKSGGVERPMLPGVFCFPFFSAAFCCFHSCSCSSRVFFFGGSGAAGDGKTMREVVTGPIGVTRPAAIPAWAVATADIDATRGREESVDMTSLRRAFGLPRPTTFGARANSALAGAVGGASSAPLARIKRARGMLGTNIGASSGTPVRGFVQWFLSQRSMAARSKTSPSMVLTGSCITEFDMGQ